MEVYTFLEKPSAGFCYKRGEKEQKPLRHFLYEIYLLRVTEKKASIDLYYKTILLTGGLNYERDYLLREIQEKARSEKVRFCFITAGSWEDRPSTKPFTMPSKATRFARKVFLWSIRSFRQRISRKRCKKSVW